MKYEREMNQKIADDVLLPIVEVVDNARLGLALDTEKMRESLKDMEAHASTNRAFPFPETQDKANLTELQNKFYEKVIELIELRNLQANETAKQGRAKASLDQIMGM